MYSRVEKKGGFAHFKKRIACELRRKWKWAIRNNLKSFQRMDNDQFLNDSNNIARNLYSAYV